MKKMNPPAFLVICSILMIAWDYWLPIIQLDHWAISVLGSVLIILGLITAKAGSDYFQKRGTNIETFSAPDILVSDGLYRYSRNPMYLGFVLIQIGLALVMGSLSASMICLFFILVMNSWYIKYEENIMFEIFGEAYMEYKAKTRRWF